MNPAVLSGAAFFPAWVLSSIAVSGGFAGFWHVLERHFFAIIAKRNAEGTGRLNG